MTQPDLPHLTPDELQRYHRHLILPGVGEEGQRRLKAARVLLIGAGGLGSPAALYLAAAGVGHLGIVDDDVVEVSNLQRQILHGTRQLGRAKVESARERMADMNPLVDVATFHTRLRASNVLEIIRGYDVVLDGSDNFETRYLVNDACIIAGIPNVYGSVIRFDGQASVFGGDGPCYRCLFRDPPPPGLVPNCAEGGVFGVLPGIVGVIQATETIKLIAGVGDTLSGRLLLVDALRMRFRTIELARDPECVACGAGASPTLVDYDAFCGVPIDTLTTAPNVAQGPLGDEIEPLALRERLAGGEEIAILDVREPYEWAIARIEDARLIPLNSLPSAAGSLDRSRSYVVYCHHGMRSDAAARWMRDHGFPTVANLVGGIERWALDVDPAMRRY